MSVKNGDTARANREDKKHRLQRQRNRELRKTLTVQTPGQEPLTLSRDEDQMTAKRLPPFTGDSKANASEGESDQEITLNHSPSGGYHD
jgi:hypothetical protein